MVGSVKFIVPRCWFWNLNLVAMTSLKVIPRHLWNYEPYHIIFR